MAELPPEKDFLGKEIEVGDKVIFEAPKYRNFVIGTVIDKTEKTCLIEFVNNWNYPGAGRKQTIRQFYGQCIRIDGDSLAFDKLLDCIRDMYRLLAKISDDAKKRDLSLMRVRGQAGPCDMYQGLPPICRIFHDIEDEHYDTIRIAMKASEPESENVEPSSNP